MIWQCFTRRDKYWAVTCHFNPSGYKTKLNNYHEFRTDLGMKLLTVELSYNARYELTEADADHYIRVSARPDSVMWHKENQTARRKMVRLKDKFQSKEANAVTLTPDVSPAQHIDS